MLFDAGNPPRNMQVRSNFDVPLISKQKLLGFLLQILNVRR